MTPKETTTFLARVHLLDNRAVDQATVAHWQELLASYTLSECIDALRTHALTSTEYLMPAHIVRLAKSQRNDAQMRAPLPSAPTRAYPKPENFDDMADEWCHPVEFAREVAVYNNQLRTKGFPPVYENPESYVA